MIQTQRSRQHLRVDPEHRQPTRSRSARTQLLVVASDEAELIEHKVEQICALGCRGVYQRIDEIGAGVGVPELVGLNRRQVTAVVTELESIMSVYTENGAVCLLGDGSD
jgi:hypothetical protein